MNHSPEKRDDDFSEFSELENRLRQARPQAPQINMAMISEGLQQSATPLIAPPVSPSATPWHFLGSMAASLVVGLVIGAGGMFYRMQTHEASVAQPNPPIPKTRPDHLESSRVAAETTSRRGQDEETATWSPSRSDFDSYLGKALDSEPDTPLWPGKYLLIAKGKKTSIRSQVIGPNPNEHDWADAADGSDTPNGSIHETSPSTSAKLLRDLLNSRELH
jgi:hypothetical protein